jgi:aerobic carbon-monoxide dehydrogenase medium subunit
MYAAPFEYHRPDTLAEAIALLGEFGDDGKLIAGGHSLVPLLRSRFARPQHLIDIRRLPGLAGIREERDGLTIGGATTHDMIERSPIVRARMPVLAEAAGMVGDPAVRNMGTIGGSLAQADPSGDWPPLVVAFGADIVVASPQGERRIPASAFFRGLLTTALEATDIITSIRFRMPPARTGAAYEKYPHHASRFAVCGVAALVSLDEQGTVGRARIAVTGYGPVVVRARAVETALTGKRPDAETIAAVARHGPDDLDVRADVLGSEEFKRNLAAVCIRRAITAAVERAGG